MITLEQLDRALGAFRTFREKHPDIAANPRIPASAAALDGMSLRIAVVGEIKKGKSSLLNALAGIEDLSPVSSDIATSVVFRLHHAADLRVAVEF